MLGFVGIDLATRPLGQVGLPHRALIGGAQPVWLVGPRQTRYKEWEGCRARTTRFTVATNPSYRNPTDLGRREADGKHPSAATTSSSVNLVVGQCRWRPEGRRDLRRPPPPPDPRLADADFLASILDSIDAMAPAGTSSSAPPPTDGLLHSTPLSLSLSFLY